METKIGRPKSDDGEILLQALKEFKEPIQKQDIPTIAPEIKWGINPTKKVERLINAAGDRIARPIRGFYQYVELKEEKPTTIPQETVTPTQPIQSAVKYKIGDDFSGVVTGVSEYGVFVENENQASGLLHRSKIRNGVAPWGLSEISKLFRLGDLVHTKIAAINPEGKISLTTVGMPLPEREDEINPAWNRLATFQVEAPAIAIEPKREEAKNVNDKEIEQLTGYLKEKFGVLSPQSRVLLRELSDKHGMFSVMLALTKTVEDFEVDLSMAFMREVEKKVVFP